MNSAKELEKIKLSFKKLIEESQNLSDFIVEFELDKNSPELYDIYTDIVYQGLDSIGAFIENIQSLEDIIKNKNIFLGIDLDIITKLEEFRPKSETERIILIKLETFVNGIKEFYNTINNLISRPR